MQANGCFDSCNLSTCRDRASAASLLFLSAACDSGGWHSPLAWASSTQMPNEQGPVHQLTTTDCSASNPAANPSGGFISGCTAYAGNHRLTVTISLVSANPTNDVPLLILQAYTRRKRHRSFGQRHWQPSFLFGDRCLTRALVASGPSGLPRDMRGFGHVQGWSGARSAAWLC